MEARAALAEKLIASLPPDCIWRIMKDPEAHDEDNGRAVDRQYAWTANPLAEESLIVIQ